MIHLINDIYVVEVPEGAMDFFSDGNQSVGFKYENELRFVHLESGNWQLICTIRECTEYYAAGIVEKDKRGYKHYWPDKGFVPRGFNARHETAYDSLYSLLNSKGLDENKNYILIKKAS